MERVFDFSNVTNYDFRLVGSNIILKLFQGDIITKICIETDKTNSMADEAHKKISTATIHRNKEKQITKRKRVPLTRLNEFQVKEIRNDWDATVKACGSRNAAAEQLATIYNCSAKNIYAIIYRYSWVNV
jgi:hypothetical protein